MKPLNVQPVSTVIKGLSIVLICGALGVELWNILGYLPEGWQRVLRIVQFVLVAHGIEAIIAAGGVQWSQANQRALHSKQPLRYGLYTFFVGFPGLIEVFGPPEETS